MVPFFKRLLYDAARRVLQGLNPGPPALEASTLRLGCRGDSIKVSVSMWFEFDSLQPK